MSYMSSAQYNELQYSKTRYLAQISEKETENRRVAQRIQVIESQQGLLRELYEKAEEQYRNSICFLQEVDSCQEWQGRRKDAILCECDQYTVNALRNCWVKLEDLLEQCQYKLRLLYDAQQENNFFLNQWHRRIEEIDTEIRLATVDS